jgi:hypothetical protein
MLNKYDFNGFIKDLIIDPKYFKYKDDLRFYFTTYSYLRNYIFQKVLNIIKRKNNINIKKWQKENYLWINNFTPSNFINKLKDLN